MNKDINNNLPICINFSGGRSSALMTVLLLEYIKDTEFVITFQNTGKEKEETLQFIYKFEEYHKINIVWLEYHPEEKFRIVNFETASRKGEPFEMLIKKRRFLPNVVTRLCTGDLKVRVAGYRLQVTD